MELLSSQQPFHFSPSSSREQTATSELRAPATELPESNRELQSQTHEQPNATIEPEVAQTSQEESRSTTRLVPEDPETRKLFIQQVWINPHIYPVDHKNKPPKLTLNPSVESQSSPEPNPKRHAPCSRSPIRPSTVRAGSPQPQITPIVRTRSLHTESTRKRPPRQLQLPVFHPSTPSDLARAQPTLQYHHSPCPVGTLVSAAVSGECSRPG